MKKRIYRTCIPVPKADKDDFFVPREIFEYETYRNLSGRDVITYMTLCSLGGVATSKQLHAEIPRASIRTVLRSLSNLVKIGHIKYQEISNHGFESNIVSLSEIKRQQILNERLRRM